MSGFPHVISVEETEKVDYSFVLKEDNFVAGDIVLWDGEKKVVASQEGFSLPTNGYTPIGVIVIPASHMDDSKARMMATRWMSCDDSENGSTTAQGMVWGVGTEISGLTNYTQVPVIARYDDEEAGGVTALTVPQEIYTKFDYGFLSSDDPIYTGETNPEDEGTRWRRSETYWADASKTHVSLNNYYIASPYASDGTPNPLYRAIEYSGGSINNPLSYFDGKHQTDVILETRGGKDYGSWKPTSGTPEDYPAASCCDMYHTVGTSQGDWYLPSQAELGYVVARLNRIKNAMARINGMQMPYASLSWGSTECTSYYASRVHFGSGHSYGYYAKPLSFNSVVAFATV